MADQPRDRTPPRVVPDASGPRGGLVFLAGLYVWATARTAWTTVEATVRRLRRG